MIETEGGHVAGPVDQTFSSQTSGGYPSFSCGSGDSRVGATSVKSKTVIRSVQVSSYWSGTLILLIGQ